MNIIMASLPYATPFTNVISTSLRGVPLTKAWDFGRDSLYDPVSASNYNLQQGETLKFIYALQDRVRNGSESQDQANFSMNTTYLVHSKLHTDPTNSRIFKWGYRLYPLIPTEVDN